MPETRTLQVPSATLAYDVREAEAPADAPVLLMIGSPMAASGFATLAGFFRDRTIVTYDPRGVDRSTRTDGAGATTPEDHADDVHRLIAELDVGPVDIFGTSGGATNGLALVARHPEQVATLVAHEPPVATVLPDRAEALAAIADISDTYQRDGNGRAMAKFIAVTSITGPIPPDFAERSADPATFGLSAEDDGSRDNPLLGDIIGGTHYELDFDALRSASTRIVIAAGVESEDTYTYRAALAVADGIGVEPVMFPSHHAGFLGGEFGQRGEPEAFAARLREVLEGGD